MNVSLIIDNTRGILMKSKAKIILSILLVAASIICLAGCKDITMLNEKFVELIDYVVVHDSNSIYPMFFPGGTDRESFDTTMEQIYDYFPVTEGYTWEIVQWDRYKGVRNGNNLIGGQYKVEFDDQVFYVAVTWRYTSEASGFVEFQIGNENDQQGNQSK